MDGILNIDKPAGETSFQTVARVKRLTGNQRVGHAGTLDPLATGVLPVCLGKGTHIVPFLLDATKTYRARIEMGVTTDTYDASGRVLQKISPSAITREKLTAALASFCGQIRQIPPMYSAVRYQGRRLYELARAGVEVERKSRVAVIHQIELIDWQSPVATVEVVCGKGTYIRSIAHDLGQALGCGASLKDLVRLKYGPFDIKDALSVSQLEQSVHNGEWRQLVYPADYVLLNWMAIITGEATSRNLRNGRPLSLTHTNKIDDDTWQAPAETSSYSDWCRAYTTEGSFLGVLRFNQEQSQWQPERIFL